MNTSTASGGARQAHQFPKLCIRTNDFAEATARAAEACPMTAYRPAAACLRSLANNETMPADEIRARLGEVADFIDAATNALFYVEADLDTGVSQIAGASYHWVESRMWEDQAKILRRWFPDGEVSPSGSLKMIVPSVASLIVSDQGLWGICPCLNPERGPINPVYGRGLTRLGALYGSISWPDAVIAWKRYYVDKDERNGILTRYTFEVA